MRIRKAVTCGALAVALPLMIFTAPVALADHPTPPAPVINPDRLTMPGNVDNGSYDETENITDADGTEGDFDYDGPDEEFQNMPEFAYSPTWPGHDTELSATPQK